MTNLKSIPPAVTLDVQGKACPYPIVLIKKEMLKLPPGAVLKILCDSEITVEEVVPRYCEKHGYELESSMPEDNYWELFIRKT